MIEVYELEFPDGQVKKSSGKTGIIIRKLLESYPAEVAKEFLAEVIGGESKATVGKLVGQLNFTVGRLPAGWQIQLTEEGNQRFYSMIKKESEEVPDEPAGGRDNSLSQYDTILKQVKDCHLEDLCDQINHSCLFPLETMSSQKLHVNIEGVDVRLATSITCITLVSIGRSIKREMGYDPGEDFGDLSYRKFLEIIDLVRGRFNPPEIEDLAKLYTSSC